MTSEAPESTSWPPQALGGLVVRATGWLRSGTVGDGLVPPVVRRLGVVWVAVSLPVITAAGFLVHSPGAYVFVLVFMACGAFTTPALAAGWYAVRHVSGRDRPSYALLFAGLVLVYVIGVAMLVGLVTGWRWANPLGVPAAVVAGLAHMVGLTRLARSRSGRRALVVDVLEVVGRGGGRAGPPGGAVGAGRRSRRPGVVHRPRRHHRRALRVGDVLDRVAVRSAWGRGAGRSSASPWSWRSAGR